MANEMLDYLMRQYGAQDWLEPEAPAADSEAPTRRVSPRELVRGMQPLRVQELEVPAEVADVAGLSRELRNAQRSPLHVTDSVWTPDGEGEENPRRLVHVRTFECDSPAAARAQLLQVLAEVQGPAVERTDVAGDVAFAAPGNTFIAGVRGNLVFVLTNGGPELMDLSEVARYLASAGSV